MAATAAAVHRVVVVETLAVALVEAVQAQALIQVLARRRLRPSSLALLAQVLTVSAVALAVLQTANLRRFNMSNETARRSVIELFEKRDVVLLGENHGVSENFDFIRSMIPELHAAGVRTIALEFAANEKQQQADELVLGKNYDEQVSRDMLFAYNVAWPYKEYQDVHKHVWNFNQTVEDKIRVLHASYIYDWSQWQGTRDRESMKGVMQRGDYNKFRADRISESLSKGGKVLGIFGAVHAVRDKRNLELFGLAAETQTLGMLLESAFPDRIASVNLNGAASGFWDLEVFTSQTFGTCAIDTRFLSGRHFSEVQANWPDPDWTACPANEDEFWKLIHERKTSLPSLD